MVRFGKRAFLSVDNLGGLLVAIGIILIFAFIFFKVIGPSYDTHQKTAESYFETLKGSIVEAEEYGSGEFTPIAKAGDKEFYFLVYFGNRNSYSSYLYSTAYGGGTFQNPYSQRYYTNFILKRLTSNTLCICYTVVSDDHEINRGDNGNDIDFYEYSTSSSCPKCIDLEWPIEFNRAEPYVFDLSRSRFLIRRSKDSGSNTKYFFEVK